MQTSPDPKPSTFREAHLRDYWKIIWQGRWTVLAIFFAVVALTVAWTLLQTPIYTASAIVEIQPKARGVLTTQDVTGLGAAGYGWLAEEKYHNTQVEIIRSRDVADRVVRLLHLADHPRFAQTTDPIDAFRKMIRVDARRESGLISISMSGPDRHEITQWINAVADAYVQRNFEKATENVTRAVAAIRSQIESLQTELSRAEGERIDTLESTKIFNSESQEDTLHKKLENFNLTLDEVRIELKKLDDRLAQVAQMQASGSDLVGLAELAGDETLRDLLSRRSEAVREFEAAKVQLRPGHPEYERATKTVDSLNAQIRDRSKLAVDDWQQRRSMLLEQATFLREQIDAAESYSLQLAKATSRYDIVKSDSETKKRIFDLITGRLQEVQLGADLVTNNVSTLDEATLPRFPDRPRKKVNLIVGAIVGLMLGLGSVFFIDYLDNTIRTPEDIEKYLTTSVLGVIPKADEGLSNRAVREAFQSLRTSIIFSSKNRQRKTLLITSTGPQEGKSSSVANLGRTLAAAGDRVIIIDCDLRRPTQHLHHQMERDHGLTNFLAAPADEGDWTVYAKPTSTPNLFIMTCGPIPPNPPELLGNERFIDLLRSLRERYEWVLIDSPPASSLADASLLAALADMTVLVVQHNRTDRDLAVKTMQQLRSVNTFIAGVVMNNIDLSRAYQKDYYFTGYYYYTEDEANAKTKRRRTEKQAQVG